MLTLYLLWLFLRSITPKEDALPWILDALPWILGVHFFKISFLNQQMLLTLPLKYPSWKSTDGGTKVSISSISLSFKALIVPNTPVKVFNSRVTNSLLLFLLFSPGKSTLPERDRIWSMLKRCLILYQWFAASCQHPTLTNRWRGTFSCKNCALSLLSCRHQCTLASESPWRTTLQSLSLSQPLW